MSFKEVHILPEFKCRKCRKLAKVTFLSETTVSVKCCGIEEKYG